MDRFNRVVGSIWTRDLSTDRDYYSVTISYDRDSNITDITDNVLKAGVSGNRNFDVKYSIDSLNRVTRAEEGTFSTGSISNRSRDEQWTLTQTENWNRDKLDLDGNGYFTGGRTDLPRSWIRTVRTTWLVADEFSEGPFAEELRTKVRL